MKNRATCERYLMPTFLALEGLGAAMPNDVVFRMRATGTCITSRPAASFNGGLALRQCAEAGQELGQAQPLLKLHSVHCRHDFSPS